MNESPSSRPYSFTPLNAGGLLQTRSSRASSTSSDGSSSSQLSSSTSSNGSASRKRKHDADINSSNDLDLRACPRTAAPALGTLRHRAGSIQRAANSTQCFTSSPASISSKSSLRYRRSKAATVTASSSKGIGKSPTTPALRRPLLLKTSGRSLTQDTVQPVEQQFKRARIEELEVRSPAFPQCSIPGSPAYAAVSKESPPAVVDRDVATLVRCRFKRASSLPLEDEISIFRRLKHATNDASETLLSRRTHYPDARPTIHVQVEAERPVKDLETALSGSAPSSARLHPSVQHSPLAIHQEKMQDVRSLTHTQLLTLHQLRLPRLSSGVGSERSAPAAKHGRTVVGVTPAPKLLFKHSRSASHAPTMTPSIPKLSPPITRNTLKELDLQEILKLRQVRHDVVFDSSLMFCPNYQGSRGDRKREANDRYWLAVTRELEMGCRCTAFSFAPSATAIQLGKPSVLLPCICQSASDGSGPYSIPFSARLPSRITSLVAELRDILLSILPLTAAEGRQDEATRANAQAMQKMIIDSLDPELITQEVVHKVLDVSALARFLGQLLKAHCAPMRDELVDVMIACIEKGKATGETKLVCTGLRMCFDILELMKLDIANHQLRLLRPYLLETAAEFELKSFTECVKKVDATKEWLKAAVERVATSPARGNNTVSLAIVDGILDLVFKPVLGASDQSASAVKQARLPNTRNPPKDRNSVSIVQPGIPETLQLDIHRLHMFRNDLLDLTIVSLLLLLYRQWCSSNRRTPTAEEMETVKKEMWVLLSDVPAQFGSRSVTKSAEKPGNEIWKENLRAVMLQLARRSASGSVNANSAPSSATLDLLNSWMSNNIQPKSKLFMLVQTRIRSVLTNIINGKMAINSSARRLPGACTASIAPEATIKHSGLYDVEREVQLLADRIATLASFHDNAYNGLYQSLITTA